MYRVTDRLLLRLGLAREADRLRGLVVVTREGVVRTVKWDFELRRRGLLRRSRWVGRWRRGRWSGEEETEVLVG